MQKKAGNWRLARAGTSRGLLLFMFGLFALNLLLVPTCNCFPQLLAISCLLFFYIEISAGPYTLLRSAARFRVAHEGVYRESLILQVWKSDFAINGFPYSMCKVCAIAEHSPVMISAKVIPVGRGNAKSTGASFATTWDEATHCVLQYQRKNPGPPSELPLGPTLLVVEPAVGMQVLVRMVSRWCDSATTLEGGFEQV